MSRGFWIAPLFLVLLSNSACSFFSSSSRLEASLTGRGVLPTSSENPYIATNQYLEEQKQESETLKGFLEMRGRPDAIALKNSLFGPFELAAYYQDKSERYLFLRERDFWTIEGPWKTETPLPQVFGSFPKNHAVIIPPETTLVNKESKTEMPPEGAAKPEAPEIVSAEKIITIEEDPDEKTAKLDRLHSRLDLSSGDMIHRVSFPGETLRFIAEWYTGDAENSERLARINGLRNPNVLKLDTSIRVPRYMLKNPKPITESDVKAYQANRSKR